MTSKDIKVVPLINFGNILCHCCNQKFDTFNHIMYRWIPNSTHDSNIKTIFCAECYEDHFNLPDYVRQQIHEKET